MCPQGQWEKVAKGSWVRSMSPFDNRILDIRTAGSSLENFVVSIEEGTFLSLYFDGFPCYHNFYASNLFNDRYFVLQNFSYIA